MGLEVAEAKSGVKRINEGFEFLGFTVLGRFFDRDRAPSLDSKTASGISPGDKRPSHFDR